MLMHVKSNWKPKPQRHPSPPTTLKIKQKPLQGPTLCACVCVWLYIHIYIYKYIRMCVCVCVVHNHTHNDTATTTWIEHVLSIGSASPCALSRRKYVFHLTLSFHSSTIYIYISHFAQWQAGLHERQSYRDRACAVPITRYSKQYNSWVLSFILLYNTLMY